MRILDHDPITGMSVSFEYNHDNDTVTIGHHQDASAILEANKLVQLDTELHQRQNKRETWARYARIPNIVIMEWLHKYGVDFNDKNHWPAVVKLINDPDYRHVKTTTYFHDR